MRYDTGHIRNAPDLAMHKMVQRTTKIKGYFSAFSINMLWKSAPDSAPFRAARSRRNAAPHTIAPRTARAGERLSVEFACGPTRANNRNGDATDRRILKPNFAPDAPPIRRPHHHTSGAAQP